MEDKGNIVSPMRKRMIDTLGGRDEEAADTHTHTHLIGFIWLPCLLFMERLSLADQ